MGPGSDKKKQNLVDPQFFNLHFLHSISVSKSSSVGRLRPRRTEKVLHKRLRSIWARPGQTMYDSVFPQSQKSIVERKISSCVLHVEQYDQLQAVKEIVEMIAYGSPIAVVSSIIISVNKVMNIHCKNIKKVFVFVSLFHRLQSEHLMIANDTPSSRVGHAVPKRNLCS